MKITSYSLQNYKSLLLILSQRCRSINLLISFHNILLSVITKILKYSKLCWTIELLSLLHNNYAVYYSNNQVLYSVAALRTTAANDNYHPLTAATSLQCRVFPNFPRFQDVNWLLLLFILDLKYIFNPVKLVTLFLGYFNDKYLQSGLCDHYIKPKVQM